MNRSADRRTVKRFDTFERSDGLNTTLYKDIPLPFIAILWLINIIFLPPFAKLFHLSLSVKLILSIHSHTSNKYINNSDKFQTFYQNYCCEFVEDAKNSKFI